jgi:hypothetical protein
MTGWEVIRAPGAAALAAEVQLDEATVNGEAYIGAFVGETCVAARPILPMNSMTISQMALMLSGQSEVHFRLWVDGVVLESEDVLIAEGGDEWGQAGNTIPIIRFSSETNGVDVFDFSSSISISPVPAEFEAWLSFELAQYGHMHIAVYDARGVEMAVLRNGSIAAGQHRISLDVSRWAAGTYFVRGVGDMGVFSNPIIVR